MYKYILIGGFFMPKLSWVGREKIEEHISKIQYQILELDVNKSLLHKDNRKSDNKIIHGDNLNALKSLVPEYAEAIDIIYIDPPYNTGNKKGAESSQKWDYDDAVDDDDIKKWIGETVGDEGEDLERHDKWLCMMYPRLKLLHSLLSQSGVIFISIDDNELANLKVICDEIFGVKNFVCNFVVENNPKGRKNNRFVSKCNEYCLVYLKERAWWTSNKKKFNIIESIVNSKDKRPIEIDMHGEYKKGKRQVIGTNSNKVASKQTNASRCFTIYYNSEKDSMRILHEYDEINDCLVLGEEGERLLSTGYTRYAPINKDTKTPNIVTYTEATVRQKFEDNDLIFLDDCVYEKERVFDQQIKSILTNENTGHDILTENAGKYLSKILGDKESFTFPKPVEFIQLLLSLHPNKNAIVLDSFAGSGTTGEAVLQLNNLDKGNRKFILIEKNEYAHHKTAERIRRVINGYSYVSDKNDIVNIKGVPGDFEYYTLGPQLLLQTADGVEINDSVDLEIIRDYVYFTETGKHINPTTSTNKFYLGESCSSGCNKEYYFIYSKNKNLSLNDRFLSALPFDKNKQYVIYASSNKLSIEDLEKYNIVYKKIHRDIYRYK